MALITSVTSPSTSLAEAISGSGVPDDERQEQRQNIDQIFHIEPGVGMVNDTSFQAQIAADEYLMDLARRRTVDPQDDLMSALCLAEIDDRAGGRGDLRRTRLQVLRHCCSVRAPRQSDVF